MIHIGCDPGVTGAICMLTPSPEWGCEVRELPTFQTQGRLRVTKHVDAVKLEHLLRLLVPRSSQITFTIEDVYSFPNSGTNIRSSDSLVESRVTCENVARMLGYTVQRVRPQTWQKFYGLKGGDKKLSIGTVQRLYPNAGVKLAKDHNKAESVLIAHWARRMAAP